MKKQWKWSVILFVVLCILGITPWFISQREKSLRMDCLSKLRSLGFLLSAYYEHNGQYPSNLQQLVDSGFITDSRLLVCPGKNGHPGPLNNVDSWSDYYYLAPKMMDHDKMLKPLLFDRKLSNHAGKGLCIFLSDASLTNPMSSVMLKWDPFAENLLLWMTTHEWTEKK
jgi:hypothetical protein